MSLLVRVYVHVNTGIYRETFIYVERPDLRQPSSLGHAAEQDTGVACLDAYVHPKPQHKTKPGSCETDSWPQRRWSPRV